MPFSMPGHLATIERMTKPLTATDIRLAYLRYFRSKGHAIIPRANLVPEGDATTLFTGSGMQPLIPYLELGRIL
jgi:alanyl-tRNA synthetase